jgi:hypothetical protein
MLFKLQILCLQAFYEVGRVGRDLKRGDHSLFQGMNRAFSWRLRKTVKNLTTAGNKVVFGEKCRA